MSTTVTTENRGDDQIARSVIVNAPVAELYELLVRPRNHQALDGRSTVQDVVSGPDRLTTGDRFSMNMKLFGIPYKLTSTAVDVQENKVVAWQHPAKHIWRWEFEELSPTTTKVTEVWDYRQMRFKPVYEKLGVIKGNARGIEETLQRLQQRFANGATR